MPWRVSAAEQRRIAATLTAYVTCCSTRPEQRPAFGSAEHAAGESINLPQQRSPGRRCFQCCAHSTSRPVTSRAGRAAGHATMQPVTPQSADARQQRSVLSPGAPQRQVCIVDPQLQNASIIVHAGAIHHAVRSGQLHRSRVRWCGWRPAPFVVGYTFSEPSRNPWWAVPPWRSEPVAWRWRNPARRTRRAAEGSGS